MAKVCNRGIGERGMTTTKFMFALSAAGLLALAACDRTPPEQQPVREQAAASADASSPDVAEAAATGEETTQQASREDRTDPRTLPVSTHEDGTPVWAANRRLTAQEAAERQFKRNGKDFGAATVAQYVDKTHDFVGSPPKGTLRHTRSNGDKLFYDPKGNVFAVATKDGAPRTMFKPEDGMSYWEKQKQTQARRRNRDSAEG